VQGLDCFIGPGGDYTAGVDLLSCCPVFLGLPEAGKGKNLTLPGQDAVRLFGSLARVLPFKEATGGYQATPLPCR